MSRRAKALKRELHAAIAEGQACMEINDTFFLHEAKGLRRRIRTVKKRGTDPFANVEKACGEIDGLTLHFMHAELNFKEGSII